MWLRNAVDVILCEIPSLIRGTKIIDSKIKKIANDGLDTQDKRTDLPLGLIQEHARFDQERLRVIEDKAKVTVTGITIALAIFVAGASRLTYSVPETTFQVQLIGHMLDGLTVIAVLYFLLAGHYAIKTIKVKPFYGVSLEDEILFESEEEKRARNLVVLDLNRRVISKYTNFVEVSYNAVRNGVASVALLIIILTVASHLSISPHQREDKLPQDRVNTFESQRNTIIIKSERKAPSDRESDTL